MTAFCPWCSAPRDSGLICPKCGADYAKAEAIKAHGRAIPATDTANITSESLSSGELDADPSLSALRHIDDPELEYKFCVGAIPIALLIAIAFNASGLGSSLQRIFLTMPVHELGHSVTAWFCGFSAIPTLWKSLIPETRGWLAPIALLGALAYMVFRGYVTGRASFMWAGGALIILQAIGTLVIKPETALMLITFGGDGCGMILAVLLMASFFFGKHTQIYQGALRWGFLVIGAAAFVDIFATWWKARSDESAIPYGTTGGMATDSMKLVDYYGWSMEALVSRYVVLGVCCLIALMLVYIWGVWRARSEMNAWQLARLKADWAAKKR